MGAAAALLLLALNALDGDGWAGEDRRMHVGIGARVHGGLMTVNGFALWVLQSEVLGVLSVRVQEHDEVRLQLGVFGGYPDTMGAELQAGFHHAFTRKWSLGVDGFLVLSPWSLRAGIEVPVILRIGSTRRHQLLFAGRLHAGAFSGAPITAWTVANQRFTFGGGLSVGYAFLF